MYGSAWGDRDTFVVMVFYGFCIVIAYPIVHDYLTNLWLSEFGRDAD
jgi:hypothetical protein